MREIQENIEWLILIWIKEYKIWVASLKRIFRVLLPSFSEVPTGHHLIDAFKAQLKLRQHSVAAEPSTKVKLKYVPSIPAVLS